MNTIIGLFDDPLAARRAVETLRDSPVTLEDVSIIARNADGAAIADKSEDVSAGEGAAVGAVWGGLVGLAALLIPGVGPFVGGGALFAALTGAVTGAVVGGIAAALIDFSGIPAQEARGYEEQVRAGKTLVAVKARDEDTAEVRRILTAAGADSVRDQEREVGAPQGTPVRVAMYDEHGQRVMENLDANAFISGSMIEDTPPAPGLTDDRPLGTRGVYDVPPGADTVPPPTREATGESHSWTSGEFVGEGQGAGPRKDTGKYDAHQWAGETQEPGKTPGDTWTSGEVVGEGQGEGPHADTGEYDSRQWVGERQGERGTTPDEQGKRRA